jgi:hypothetical protein
LANANFLAFCRLPRLLYSGQEGFAAPLDADRWGLFARRLNPHFKRVQSQFWLARKNGKLAGRIFAQVYDETSAPRGASRAQWAPPSVYRIIARVPCLSESER